MLVTPRLCPGVRNAWRQSCNTVRSVRSHALHSSMVYVETGHGEHEIRCHTLATRVQGGAPGEHARVGRDTQVWAVLAISARPVAVLEKQCVWRDGGERPARGFERAGVGGRQSRRSEDVGSRTDQERCRRGTCRRGKSRCLENLGNGATVPLTVRAAARS